MMGNLGGLFKQLQQAQQRAEQMKEELATETIEVKAGDGLAVIVANGLGEVSEIRLNAAELGLSEDDAELLADVLVVALRELSGRAAEKGRGMLSELTGGLPLPPGLGL